MSDDGAEAEGSAAQAETEGATGDVDPESSEEPRADVHPETSPAGEAVGADWTPAWLRSIRADPHRRHVALVAAALVGLGLSWLHWLGLVAAGALVGLASETLPKALAAGLALGGLVLVVHVGASPVMGPAEFLGLAPAAYVTIGAALVAPLWGSLARGVL